MTRTRLQALQLHLLAVENFLYRHRKEIAPEECKQLSKTNAEMLAALETEFSPCILNGSGQTRNG
jgi:hypothetical protein